MQRAQVSDRAENQDDAGAVRRDAGVTPGLRRPAAAGLPMASDELGPLYSRVELLEAAK